MYILKKYESQEVVVHIYISSPGEAEAGGFWN